VIDRFLPSGRARFAVIGVGLTVALLVYTQFLLPGDSSPARGTPTAILFQGLLIGLVNALTAAGIILIYRSSRVISFAQLAIGAIAGVFVNHMVAYNPGFPFPLTLIIALAASAAAGALLELIFARRFANSPRLVLMVVTIAGAGLLVFLAFGMVSRLPFFPPLPDRGTGDLADERVRSLLPLSGFKFNVGALALPVGFPELLALEMGATALVGLALFLRYTRAGVAIRAVAENSERAALLGVGVGALSTTVWAVAGAMSGVTSVANSLMGDPGGIFTANPGALVAPLAAAALARFTNLPVAVGAALLIGVGANATQFSYNGSQPVILAVLLVVVVVALLLRRRATSRVEESNAETSWQATEESRPIPEELRGITSLRITRWVLAGIALAVVAIFPFLAAARLINLGSVIALLTIVALSLVVLTGWAGQVSLGQFAFVAVGAALAGALNDGFGWSFWLVLPLATVGTALVAALLGLPALRIKGLYLAVVTLGFAAVVGALFASPTYLRDDLPRTLQRPSLFFIDFEDDRSMYFLCLAALVAVVLIVMNLRRSRFGRLLIATRENESNVQSFGIGVVRMKLLAFIVSGGMAGFAGAIYAFQQRGVAGTSYGADRSFQIFIVTILGGISSAGGALLGSAYGALTAYFFVNNVFLQAFAASLPLLLLYIAPGGLISLVNQVRDSWLRIIAQRRQIIVPSLFADFDPDALARRLVPLAEPGTGQGLAALAPGTRYSLPSEVHRSRPSVPQPAAQRLEREAAALGAAVESVQPDPVS
jgi:branched-chain amino acid transport system permease protein